MRIFPRSRAPAALPDVIVPTRLLTLRLTKLFENTRALLALLDDGREKADGEYILDYHYVSSLVEKVLERTHMIVHDSCILAPEGGQELYDRLSASARLAKEMFVNVGKDRIADLRLAERTSPGPVEPEYVLLRQALQWMTGNESGSELSVIELLDNVLDRVFRKRFLADIPCDHLPFVEVDTDCALNRVCVIDLDESSQSLPGVVVAVDRLNSRPFGLVVLGADEERVKSTKSPRCHRWSAAMSLDSLNMSRTDPDTEVFLSVGQSGDPDTDFIFVLCGEGVDTEGLIACGFKTERTSFGSMAFIYDTSAEELDEHLTQMGKALFSAS